MNAALRVEDLGRPDGVKVSGRGELHLGILIEEMRREGMELCVSRPEVITQRDEQGRLLEPMEELTVDVPNEYRGIVIEKLAQRKGELTGMYNAGTGAARLRSASPPGSSATAATFLPTPTVWGSWRRASWGTDPGEVR